jgi:FkbM family methyltransferase
LEVVKRLGLLRPGSVVFDVGAHQGCYSLCFASWVGPRGHVYSFEPFPQNADLIRYNAQLNRAQNITVVEAAVGATKGRNRVS